MPNDKRNYQLLIVNCQLSIVGSMLVFLLAACEAEPPAHIKDPGHLIFLGFGRDREVQCSRCHGEEGTGGMFGPKLRGIVQRKGEEHVREAIRNGFMEEDEEEMPPFAQKLSEEEIEQVLRFVATLRDSARE